MACNVTSRANQISKYIVGKMSYKVSLNDHTGECCAEKGNLPLTLGLQGYNVNSFPAN
jgi:hypothetical protein